MIFDLRSIILKKLIILVSLFSIATLAIAENTTDLPQDSTPHKASSIIEKIKEREKELQVPRDTVPVTESKYIIDTPIPQTAYYLPFLQTLLNIKPGTLPNPIGLSVIGSYTKEKYKVKSFRGTMGSNIGGIITSGIVNNQEQILPSIDAAIDNNKQIPKLLRPIVKNLVRKIINNQQNQQNVANFINTTLGAGKEKEWQLSDGSVEVATGAVGLKADMFLFPFMQLFFTTAYIHTEQSTNVGNATIPLDKPLSIGKKQLSEITFPVGTISNVLDGYLVMGGTNLLIGYKGFFASFMVAGGYVELDDLKNDIKGFVQKPMMYFAPRIGYTYEGIFTIHTGVQRIELFGSTKGSDLSKITGGLVEGFSTEIEKFPVTFLAGAQFMFMRDLGLSIEYVGSPDTNGINAEIAWRF